MISKQTKNKNLTQISNVPQTSRVWLLWIGSGIILLISLLNLGLWSKNKIAGWQRQPVEQEITKWEEVVNKTPTYRDGYLKLATLYWKLKDDEKAKTALNRAIEIDPNYKGIEKIKEILGY